MNLGGAVVFDDPSCGRARWAAAANPKKIDDLGVFVQMANIRWARYKSASILVSDALLKSRARRVCA